MGYTGSMQNKFIPTLIGIAVIAATGGLAYWQDGHEAPATPSVPSNEDAAQAAYSAADVASHNSSSDCWSIINGGVYDLTSWIPRHPGGERAIEGLCGKDGSAAFNGQHGGGAAQAAILVDLSRS
ncbi:cytochrome b5 domain-containing protein [bacterium]|nr:cytochrome b5 domain-containing protein [bacterium]